MKEIYLAGGCFWGTQHYMSLIKGVAATEVGYANATVSNPSYEQVCSGSANAAETVKVVYDPAVVSLSFLLNMFFRTIDPTALNRQGNDIGTQYRTGIYYTDKADEAVVTEALRKVAAQYRLPIQTESGMLCNFYPAEEYHQDYLRKNPRGYCHIGRRLMQMAAQATDNQEIGNRN